MPKIRPKLRDKTTYVDDRNESVMVYCQRHAAR